MRLSELTFFCNKFVLGDKFAFTITKTVAGKRKANPYDLDTPSRAKKFRRTEFIKAGMIINGTTKENTTPLVLGRLDMLNSLCHPKILTKHITETKTKLSETLFKTSVVGKK